MKRILVIGATGTVGREVVSQLLETGSQVRAMTRNPGAVHFPPEVETVRGDLTLPETLPPALDGMDAVFLVWTAPVETSEAVVDQMARSVRRVVYLTAPHQTQHPLFQQPNPVAVMHTQVERLIQTSGLS